MRYKYSPRMYHRLLVLVSCIYPEYFSSYLSKLSACAWRSKGCTQSRRDHVHVVGVSGSTPPARLSRVLTLATTLVCSTLLLSNPTALFPQHMPEFMNPHAGDKRKSDLHDLNSANRKRATVGSPNERRPGNGGQSHKDQYWMVQWYADRSLYNLFSHIRWPSGVRPSIRNIRHGMAMLCYK